MASPAAANPEASEVRRRGRQRLIGAVALVAVLVVFVPMLLDSEPRPKTQGPALAIPSKTNAPPLPAPPAATATPAATPPAATSAEPKVAAVAPRTDPKAAESKVLEPSASKPPPPKAAPPEPAIPAKPGAQSEPAPRLEGFAVQVGAFRDAAKLDQARQRLAAAKVPHYTERLDAKDGALTRLRAGPFPTREAAESALATLKLSALEGKVVPLP